MLGPLGSHGGSVVRRADEFRSAGDASRGKQQKALKSACQEFESVMLGQLLKLMRSSVQSVDPLNQGPANSTWRDMLDDERARAMAKSGGIGLADQMYRQLASTCAEPAPGAQKTE